MRALCVMCVLIRTQCYVIMAFIDAFDFFRFHQKGESVILETYLVPSVYDGGKVESRRPFFYISSFAEKE
jgi:hypothetical protein